MVLQVLIHILLLSCLVLNTAASKLPPPPMAKQSCLPSCGNISIPFPFGIGEECFIDEWFEVVCKNNATLVLRHFNLPVISIDIRPRFGSLVVNLPKLTFQDCHTKQSSPDLGGSPFAFDSNWNKFTAMGCSAFAGMSSESNDTGRFLAGCSLHCNGTNSCGDNSGVYCQTPIPPKLQFFSANFTPETTTSKREKKCSYAFLVSHVWSSPSVKNIAAMSEVPVVLNWILYDNKIGALGKSDDSFLSNNDYSKKHPSELRSDRCYKYPVSVNQSQFVHCICAKGFEGNPYLVDGCKDIDECAQDSNVCPDKSHCENRNGSYVCNHTGEKTKEVLEGLGSGVGAMSLLLGSTRLYKVLKRRRYFQRGEMFFKRNGGDLLLQQLSLSEDNVESTVEVIVEDTSEVKVEDTREVNVEDTREVKVEDTREVKVEKTKLFDSEELEKATDRFNKNRVVGQGGRGTVYKGMLADGKTVAIKKSKIGNKKEFIDEVVKLSKVNHRNVVKLLGCCLKTRVPLLVYEYVPYGTLSQYICDEQEGELSLTWQIRLRIATEVAGALSYLHSLASPIYHKDINSRNILLDGKYRAKVADFGISRSVAIDQTDLTTADTFVYLDPEYFRSRKFTDKSDVYSFGVVLVELLTGQKPISIERSEESRSLEEYFMLSIEEGNLLDIVDARVKEEGKEEAITAFAALAKRCLKFSRRKRPTMKEVATSLGDIQKLEGDSGVHQEENLEEKLEEDSGVHHEENLEENLEEDSGVHDEENLE